MTTPYYEDEHVTLYHGDSLEILPTLDVEASALLTDPPYFKVKQDEWDNQWDKAGDFLSWMGEWLDMCKPLIAANGSVWVFASPALTSSVERVVAERFKVLNSIRWVKQAGWHQKAELGAMRRFTSPWEGIVFAEQYGADSTSRDGLWASVHEPIRQYLNELRESAGMTVQDINIAWQTMRGTKGQTPGHWYSKSQWLMPTPEHYEWMLDTLGVRGREYEDLRREYEDLRRPFAIADRALSTDVWTYPTVSPYAGKHPCEKPVQMLEDMIRTSTRPGDLVLDPFAGSGSTLVAARNLGRRAVGIEKDERYCATIAERLQVATLDFAA